MSNLSGPVPRGLRLTFVVLTLGTVAFAVAAAVKGVWLLVVVVGVFAVCNVAILWATRSGVAARTAPAAPAAPEAGPPATPPGAGTRETSG